MAPHARVVIVGLGPAGADLLLPAARAAIEAAATRYTRTAHHPAVRDLERDGILFETFDALYDTATDLESVYEQITAALVAGAADGEVVYAVPGNPTVAERSVELLSGAAREHRVELVIVPGLSFAELAWTRVRVDPMTSGARIVDGRTLDPATIAVGGPMLVGQCDTSLVLSDVKLTLLEHLAPDTAVTILHHLGLADEWVVDVALSELDRVIEPDHLTAVWIPSAGMSTTAELARLLALAARLRAPDGCPWDAEQTHHSLTRYLLEESYEVVEAVEQLPPDAPAGTAPDDPAYVALVDELGDLLYQVIFHAVLADEAGAFGMAKVARGIHDKLVRRHPHVFGDADADTSADVMANWEQIKMVEKGSESIVAGITPGLPSLLYAHKLLRKGASVGLDPGGVTESLARIDAATASLRSGADDPETVLGGLLAAAVALARSLGVDTESALRGWAARFKARFEGLEREARARGLDLHTMPAPEVEALWAEVSAPA